MRRNTLGTIVCPPMSTCRYVVAVVSLCLDHSYLIYSILLSWPFFVLTNFCSRWRRTRKRQFSAQCTMVASPLRVETVTRVSSQCIACFEKFILILILKSLYTRIAIIFLHYLSLTTHPSHPPRPLASPPAPGTSQGVEPADQGR